ISTCTTRAPSPSRHSLSLHYHRPPPPLHSFPTRRSSDLTPSHSSCEHPNRNKLHVPLASPNSFRRLAEDVSKLPKFLSVLSVLRQRQQFVVPIDVQVIFVLGL